MKLKIAILFLILSLGQSGSTAWDLHIIDNNSKGADGVRLADINSDGLMDVTTGWEEGGMTRVYLNPGKGLVKHKWPAVSIGQTPSVEDAVFADMNGDSVLDVVTCCEGKTQQVFVHWAPGNRKDLLDGSKWITRSFEQISNKTMFMFAAPVQIDNANGIDLVIGSKGNDAGIGWLQSPKDGSDIENYKWYDICSAGWIMSIIPSDMDNDGDTDMLITDRKGSLRGCKWLENPGSSERQKMPWPSHMIGCDEWEVMFAKLADIDQDGLMDVALAARRSGINRIFWFKRLDASGRKWQQNHIEFPPGTGGAKAVGVGDINLDGKMDIVFSCESSKNKLGVMWLSYDKYPTENTWSAHDVSGLKGIKYDRIELIDLDLDGDLDVMTCEESEPDKEGKRKGLGVIWYENPRQRLSLK